MSFVDAFSDEIEKVAYLGVGIPLKNIVFHTIMNTKALPPLRKFLTRLGDDFFATGFRHGIVNKEVAGSHPVGLALGTLAGPNPMYLYQSGHKYGKKIFKAIDKLPLVSPKGPYHMIRAADIGIGGVLSSAPVTMGVGGAAYGYATGKTKKEPMPLKAILSSAALGALAGLGARKFGPKAPGIAHIRKIRKGVIDPALKGSGSVAGKLLDPFAK